MIEVLGKWIKLKNKSKYKNFSIPDDIFGIGIFGRRSTPWWQKDNVCVKREVLEEDDEETKNVDIQVSGNAQFHMQVILISSEREL